jgi:AraC-like DNA-binding protein
MDWFAGMNAVLRYIEDNLTEDISLEELAKFVGCSVYEFSRIFSFVARVTISEYIRRRKLSQAVFDIQTSKEKIINIALKYGYESPTTFNRAFKDMHGTTPLSARKSGVQLKIYQPMSFTLQMKGITPLNYRLERREAFKLIGRVGYMSVEDSQNKPLSLWNTEIKYPNADNHSEQVDVSALLHSVPDVPNEIEVTFTKIDDTKTKIKIGFGMAGNSQTKPYMTAAIGYHLTDGKVKAVAGFAEDELKNMIDDRTDCCNDAGSFIRAKSENIANEDFIDTIPAANWAVFSFTDERNAANVAEAYTNILTEWFTGNAYRRRVDMPHLERFSFDTNPKDKQKAWEIWMPVEHI